MAGPLPLVTALAGAAKQKRLLNDHPDLGACPDQALSVLPVALRKRALNRLPTPMAWPRAGFADVSRSAGAGSRGADAGTQAAYRGLATAPGGLRRPVLYSGYAHRRHGKRPTTNWGMPIAAEFGPSWFYGKEQNSYG